MLFSRNFSNLFNHLNKNNKKRLFSCNYYYEKPWFSPFFASLTTGSLFFLGTNINLKILSVQIEDLNKELKLIKEKK